MENKNMELIKVANNKQEQYNSKQVSNDFAFELNNAPVIIPPLNEFGLSELFSELYMHKVYYSKDSNQWLSWDEKLFERSGITVERLAKSAVLSLKEKIFPNRAIKTTAGGYVTYDQVLEFVHKSSKRSIVKATLELAKSINGITSQESDFDNDPTLLNCKNGVVNLKTGELQNHDPKFKQTKIAGASYNPNAPCERWLKFIDGITKNRKSLKLYLQVAGGYSLTGLTSEQILFIFYGLGSNGKSTFLSMLLKIAGSYGMTTPSRTFTLNNSRLIRNDLARLKGARIVSAIEMNQGIQLDEALVKQATGGDTIAASFLRCEIFEFLPAFKPIIAANVLPDVVGADDGIARRIKVIPFEAKFSKDKTLTEILDDERDGILAWFVQGAIEWFKNGLPECAEIDKATESFRTINDQIREFLKDCCERQSDSKITVRQLFDSYLEWTKETNYERVKIKQFGSWMRQKGFEQCKSGSNRYWKGITLKFVSENIVNTQG